MSCSLAVVREVVKKGTNNKKQDGEMREKRTKRRWFSTESMIRVTFDSRPTSLDVSFSFFFFFVFGKRWEN